MKLNTKKITAVPSNLKMLLNDWSALADVIKQTTQTSKINTRSNQHDNLLSDSQVVDAINGPLSGFFQQKLTSYARINKIKMMATLLQDDNMKKLVDKFEKEADEKPIMDAAKKFSPAALDKIQTELDTCLESHFTQWQEKILGWQQEILMNLMANQIEFNDFELEQLKQLTPLSEVLEEFDEYKVPMPRLKENTYSFASYFRLKSMLIIRSALSRAHQPHEASDIESKINALKPTFKHITQEEISLLTEQLGETNEALKTLTNA